VDNNALRFVPIAADAIKLLLIRCSHMRRRVAAWGSSRRAMAPLRCPFSQDPVHAPPTAFSMPLIGEVSTSPSPRLKNRNQTPSGSREELSKRGTSLTPVARVERSVEKDPSTLPRSRKRKHGNAGRGCLPCGLSTSYWEVSTASWWARSARVGGAVTA
jgi:hypothetical protein